MAYQAAYYLKGHVMPGGGANSSPTHLLLIWLSAHLLPIHHHQLAVNPSPALHSSPDCYVY